MKIVGRNLGEQECEYKPLADYYKDSDKIDIIKIDIDKHEQMFYSK